MGGLTSLAWRSLAARPGRTLLSIVGIALGVGVLFASLATEAGIDASIDRTVRDLVGRADLRVAAFQDRTLSADSVAAIADAPGVVVAAPVLERRTYLAPSVDNPDALPPPVTIIGIDPALEARAHSIMSHCYELLGEVDLVVNAITTTPAFGGPIHEAPPEALWPILSRRQWFRIAGA